MAATVNGTCSTGGLEASGTTFDISHTVAAGLTNGLLIANLKTSNGMATHTATWNGTAMTQYSREVIGGNTISVIFWLANPESGTHNLTFTYATGASRYGGVVTLQDANQTTPFDIDAQNNGASSTATCSANTTQDNCLMLGFVNSGDGGSRTFAPGAGETELYDVQAVTIKRNTAYSKPAPTAGTQTLTEAITGGDTDWYYDMIGIVGAAGGAAVVSPLSNLSILGVG